MRLTSQTIAIQSGPSPRATGVVFKFVNWGRIEVFLVLNGKEEKAFTYYDDELHFHTDEFTNCTMQEALELYHKKDVAYLRS